MEIKQQNDIQKERKIEKNQRIRYVTLIIRWKERD
jgi:hypothetical protein